MRTLYLILPLAVSAALISNSAVASLSVKTETVVQNNVRIEIAHQGRKAKHRHCHKRFRRSEFVRVCHNHEHSDRHIHGRG